MQIVKKAVVRKMVVNGRLYGRIHVVVPGSLVGKEVIVVVWTEPTLEELKTKRKGIKLNEGKEKPIEEIDF
jgi:16S rRNA U516 pseudouridylate synthase RsuA-like enzyme